MKKFISLEGIDGAGKSSHIPYIIDYLTNLGHQVVSTREPGGTPLGEVLRNELLNRKMYSDTELLLMFAARAELLATVIHPALEEGKIVLSDRFHDSSYAFQGGGRRIPFQHIADLDQWVGLARPDLTLYFDVPTDVAFKRVGARSDADKFESEAEAFHARVREEYLWLAEQDPERIKIIDSSKTIEEVREQIKVILDEAYVYKSLKLKNVTSLTAALAACMS